MIYKINGLDKLLNKHKEKLNEKINISKNGNFFEKD